MYKKHTYEKNCNEKNMTNIFGTENFDKNFKK